MSQANPIPATLTYDPETDRPQEECGVFAVYNAEDAGVLTALGLHALQHRGQEACGIATHDGSRFHIERYLGLVGENFTSPDMPQRLPGKVAIGHARYSTQGASVLRNVQPLYSDVRGGGIALAHNGNLTNARVLREELVSHGAIFQSTSDSEVVLHLAAQSKKTKLTNRVLQALKQVQGAFAFVALVNDRLIAARDPYGIRPLVMGSLGEAVIFASETCALDMVGRDLHPRYRTRRGRGGERGRHPDGTFRAGPPCTHLRLRIHLFRPPRLGDRRPLGLRGAQADGPSAGAGNPGGRGCGHPRARQRRPGGDRLFGSLGHSLRTGHHPLPLRRPDLHPADPRTGATCPCAASTRPMPPW